MSSAPDVAAFLSATAERVEAELEAVLPRPDDEAPQLAEAMRHATLGGGKRLRPALAVAACEAVGGRAEDAMPVALAVELVHAYSLVHDDLPAMDDDDLRRGRPTCHKVFGEALAILAGDALHTLAFGVLLERVADPAVARDLAVGLARATGFAGMVGGQVADLAWGHAPPDAGRLRGIHARKTGALIRAATCGGGRVGGAGDEHLEALAVYGEHLGLAFQVLDDVLDATGTAEVLGKTPGKDARDGKLTYVRLEGVEAARERAAGLVARAREALAPLPEPALLDALALHLRDRRR